METATPIIFGVLTIITALLIIYWIFITAWHDEILDFIAKIKPFNAKRKYKKDLRISKRDCKRSAKALKTTIRNERNQIKEEINNSIGYCYVDIIHEENIDWLKKKGFRVEPNTNFNEKHFYRISWCK